MAGERYSERRGVAIVQTLSTLILVSLGHVLTKLALSDVPPFTMSWLSVGVGMVALNVYTFVIRRESFPKGLSKQIWFYIFVVGILNYVVSRIMLTLSLERLPATTNMFLVNFVGFVTMGMSSFILKEAPTKFQVLGAGVALGGLLVFLDHPPPAFEVVGFLFVLIGILAIAYTNNVARKVAIITEFTISNNVFSSLGLLVGGIITILLGLAFDWPPRIAGWQNWGVVLYLGIMVIAVHMTVWNYILRTLRSYEASILGATTLIWTALLAVPILDEALLGNQISGIILMIVGLALVQVRRGRLKFVWRRAG